MKNTFYQIANSMEANKDLIVKLIRADLKHNQLILGLKKASLDAGAHYIDILAIVARLMGVRKGEVSDQFSEVYFSFMEKAPDYPVTDLGKELKPLAKECYEMLVACQKVGDTGLEPVTSSM